MTFYIGVDLHIGNDGFSRKNSPVDYFQRVSEQLCCEGKFTVHVRTEEESESLDQIRQYPTTPDGYAEFLARIADTKQQVLM